MMKKNEESFLMDHEKQFTPLEKEVSPEDAFIKGSIFTLQERGLRKKPNIQTGKNPSSS